MTLISGGGFNCHPLCSSMSKTCFECPQLGGGASVEELLAAREANERRARAAALAAGGQGGLAESPVAADARIAAALGPSECCSRLHN